VAFCTLPRTSPTLTRQTCSSSISTLLQRNYHLLLFPASLQSYNNTSCALVLFSFVLVLELRNQSCLTCMPVLNDTGDLGQIALSLTLVIQMKICIIYPLIFVLVFSAATGIFLAYPFPS
jgi:hypothetical protein